MLLHKLYINVAIRHILMYRKSLYDLPRRKCKNHGNYELCQAKNRFSAIFPKISNLRYMLLHKLYINVAIRHILMYRKSLYDLPRRKCKNHGNYELCQAKNRFSAIFPKISNLRYMLLHKLYINVAIRHILMYRKSLYDLPGPIYKNSSNPKTLEKGVAENARMELSTKMPYRPNVLSII